MGQDRTRFLFLWGFFFKFIGVTLINKIDTGIFCKLPGDYGVWPRLKTPKVTCFKPQQLPRSTEEGSGRRNRQGTAGNQVRGGE